MQPQVYHSHDIQAWEQRWFAQNNSALGLMQQVAWQMAQQLDLYFGQNKQQQIAIWCGQGNNAGDGYYLAAYLTQLGYAVDIYAAQKGDSSALQQAYLSAKAHAIPIYHHFNLQRRYSCHIDALFGIGLNRELDEKWQNVIHAFNQQSGLKVSIDISSGLKADTGQPLPYAVKADITLTCLGYKAGLFTGQGKEYSGEVKLISLIPLDDDLVPLAYLTANKINLPQRQAFGHKGDYGHVLIIGGHANMGGAVMMAAEAAFATGVGKVTVVCDAKHHIAILARAPNIMLRDINQISDQEQKALLEQVDAVSFGMGLGRDQWAQKTYQKWIDEILQSKLLAVVLDADALWFLAQQPRVLSSHVYLTPHAGEAAKLLGMTSSEIEQDRIDSVHQLQQKYAGNWVLKGAGSLILEADKLSICMQGNAGMGTGGMGDVLSGMVAGLKAQFKDQITFADIVTLHAQAGDLLAKKGMRGIHAQQMPQAIYTLINE